MVQRNGIRLRLPRLRSRDQQSSRQRQKKKTLRSHKSSNGEFFSDLEEFGGIRANLPRSPAQSVFLIEGFEEGAEGTRHDLAVLFRDGGHGLRHAVVQVL